MTPPALIYLAVGLLVARIELEKTQTRGYTWLQWAQFLVDAARIVLLWPLVLLAEKIEHWLKSESTDDIHEKAANIAPVVEQTAGKEVVQRGES